MPHKLLLLILLSAASTIRYECFGFSIVRPTAPRSGSAKSQLRSEILRDETFPEILDVPSVSSKIEVWLDLRGTSITPETALEFWRAEVQDMQIDWCHAQQVPFTKCLISYDEQELPKNEMNVLMVDTHGNSFSAVSDKQSASIGDIVRLEPFQSNSMPTLPDPLPLIDKLSNGKWLLLDTKAWKKIDTSEKLDLLFPLVELVTPMKQSGESVIGWTCHSKSEVIRSAMWARAYHQSSLSQRSTKTIASGIIIPDDTQPENTLGMARNDRTKFVILIPYDLGMLKTALSFIEDNDAVC